MRPIFNQHKFRYSLDTCFERVMRACAETSRGDQDGTWISEPFLTGYTTLFQAGLAHSMEVWQGDELVGGLYGIALGKIFYGESMFAQAPNASKAGFITLVRALEKAGFWLIDCQQQTSHLESLGAKGISRDIFLDYLGRNAYERTHPGPWTLNTDDALETR